MKKARDDQQQAICLEIPSSPSNAGMTIDAGSDPSAIEVRQHIMPMSVARIDPQPMQDDHRVLELEAQVTSLKHALLEQQVSGQNRTLELNAHLREQARLALNHQQDEFKSAAQSSNRHRPARQWPPS